MSLLASHIFDIIRLIAVPVFVWAAYTDIKTRRVTTKVWILLAGIGTVLLIGDALLVTFDLPTHRYQPAFWITIAISIFGVIPLSYLGWLYGLYGGADAKALMALAILFPIPPRYTLDLGLLGLGNDLIVLPEYLFPVSIFALTIFVNSVLLSMFYPVILISRNILTGNFSKAMFLAKPLSHTELETAHGVLYETQSGHGRGLDLDVLRSYLAWRDIELSDLEPFHTSVDESDPLSRPLDPWGVSTFSEETDDLLYGMDEDTIHDGLSILYDSDEVWMSPGIPYMVPFTAGLCVALTHGNLMIGIILFIQQLSF